MVVLLLAFRRCFGPLWLYLLYVFAPMAAPAPTAALTLEERELALAAREEAVRAQELTLAAREEAIVAHEIAMEIRASELSVGEDSLFELDGGIFWGTRATR